MVWRCELIRKEHYGTLRGLRLEGKRLDDLNRFLIGATIAAVRDGKPVSKMGAKFVLQAGDLLVVLGDHKALDNTARLINPAFRIVSRQARLRPVHNPVKKL